MPTANRALRLTISAGLLSVIVLLPACARAPSWQGGAPGEGRPIADATWPFWPQRMRIHPLSRIVIDPRGGNHIETHIEFLDADSVTSRATGVMQLNLYDRAEGALAPSLLEWEVYLNELGRNRSHFDTVMRTYFFRLNLHADTLPRQPMLVARFLSDDGLTFESRLTLRELDDPIDRQPSVD